MEEIKGDKRIEPKDFSFTESVKDDFKPDKTKLTPPSKAAVKAAVKVTEGDNKEKKMDPAHGLCFEVAARIIINQQETS